MGPDPNADLIGQRWHHGGEVFVVTGTAPWAVDGVMLEPEYDDPRLHLIGQRTLMRASDLRRWLRSRVRAQVKAHTRPPQ